MSGATVTPTGVREGDLAALAALCAVRGPSVLAYCRQVAGEADAPAAAADAFARFRVAVVAAGDTNTLNPEALLIGATRTSAAARARTGVQGHCAAVPALLAARAERTISIADLERLEAHLQDCWGCRAPVARFKAAERAYRDPPEKTIEPALAAQIVEALVAAVPPPAPPKAPAASPNGAEAHADSVPVADAHVTQAFAIEQPTEHFAAPGPVEADPESAPDADADAAAADRPRRARARRGAAAGAGAGAAALLARLRPGSSERGPRERPAAREPREPAEPPPPLDAAARRERRERARPGLRLGLVLPIILILLALLGALYVSGVFGGNDPESSPGVSAPLAEPDADSTEPELVVVPGAKEASAAAVERAKARERGDSVPATKQPATAKAGSTRASSPPPAASPPPPAAASPPAAPAVSANRPVTRPAPQRDTDTSAEQQIDAGSGATGAEQVPPAADASDVPDLAPPLEPATP